MNSQTIYQIALTMINGVGDILARQLVESFDSPETIFQESVRALEKIPGIGRMLATEIKSPLVIARAEKEIEFINKNNIRPYFITDEDYPYRLKECPDAPVLFYTKGNVDLNTKRIISIVGTRKVTSYGIDLTEKLIKELASLYPDLLIVSGLAYGIDILAHTNALKKDLPTAGVLAHGLDRIYPHAHRKTAIEMLTNGGLVTDFPSGTNPDRPNFVKRNRIVAGLADATVVIESAEKGGSLITADIAFSYGRDVFAFPGRVGDAYSKGCNQMIRQNKAGLITSGEDLIAALCWDESSGSPNVPVQTTISFPEKEEHTRILSILKEKEDIHINQLVVELNMPVHEVSTFLFDLEMDGYIRAIPGNRYRLIVQ